MTTTTPANLPRVRVAATAVPALQKPKEGWLYGRGMWHLMHGERSVCRDFIARGGGLLMRPSPPANTLVCPVCQSRSALTPPKPEPVPEAAPAPEVVAPPAPEPVVVEAKPIETPTPTERPKVKYEYVTQTRVMGEREWKDVAVYESEASAKVGRRVLRYDVRVFDYVRLIRRTHRGDQVTEATIGYELGGYKKDDRHPGTTGVAWKPEPTPAPEPVEAGSSDMMTRLEQLIREEAEKRTAPLLAEVSALRAENQALSAKLEKVKSALAVLSS